MEDTSGPVIQAPFGDGALSESPFGDLISHWLDEGDRLSASAADVPAPSFATERRPRHAPRRLQPVFARHRLFVFVGVGLLPLALILCTNRSSPAQPPAATLVLALPVATPIATESRPAGPAAQTHTAPMPTPTPTPTPMPTPMPTWVAAATAPLATAEVAAPQPPPHRHHHHHHHHHA